MEQDGDCGQETDLGSSASVTVFVDEGRKERGGSSIF